MKTIKAFLFKAGVIALIMMLSSCDEIFNGSNKGLTFLVATGGNTTTGLKSGLYTMKVGKKEPTFTFVSEYRPWAFQLNMMDYVNGRIAFSVERSLVPKGESGIAWMDVKTIDDVRFVPIPTAEKDYHYQVPDERPRVLNDGRIAYRVVHNTDNAYDDYHCGMLAIYDPDTDEIELSGDPSSFVLAQPEKGVDTEGGSMGEGFCLSPDDQYAYCTVYGYGTDWGVFHVDYKFVVKYEIGAKKGYERMAQTADRPTTVTGNNKYLILTGNGLQKIDLATKKMTKVDDWANEFNPGQFSKSSSRMFKIWRGSGMGEFDWDATPVFTHIIDGGKISNSSYRGLGHGGQYSSDETLIYFTGSTDFYTNYATDLVVYSTPKVTVNETPDSVTTMPLDYCSNIFLLLND